ncbi:methyltransferase domain-containing protein [Plectosphaerella plurivora]|uniref:Methyltransferase domain-containing protein n=1 Tax=Plectosphaerella plurivora TaxID=936078 RepID=A0A9P8V4E6_9PEZI|nr:methyltransferase domain-containing protein [Plectosphaerella plurivora]
MPLLSNLSVASLVAIIAYQYYNARSTPIPSPTSGAEVSWKRYLGRREGILQTLNVTKNPDAPLFPIRESWDESSPMYTAWDLFPAAYPCPYELERVGHLGDGGKWVCGMSQYEATTRPQVMYSFGVGGEVSLEVEWIRRTNTYVHSFDYTVTTTEFPGLDKMTDRFKLQQLGVAGEDYIEDGHRFATLKTIMTDLGHDYVDVIKMDVEGSEFPTLDSFLEDYEGKALPFGQLLIEIHLWEGSPDTIPDLLKWWEKLESFGLRPVSDEANLLAVTFGSVIPCCFEYTFINTNDTRGIKWR